jgi:hypothetical protein
MNLLSNTALESSALLSALSCILPIFFLHAELNTFLHKIFNKWGKAKNYTRKEKIIMLCIQNTVTISVVDVRKKIQHYKHDLNV